MYFMQYSNQTERTECPFIGFCSCRVRRAHDGRDPITATVAGYPNAYRETAVERPKTEDLHAEEPKR